MNGATGSEQSGIRPVVIVQNDKGNHFSDTTIVAMITSKKKKANGILTLTLPKKEKQQSEVKRIEIK